MTKESDLGVGNVIGPEIFGASPRPIYHAGFLGSFICLCRVIALAAGTVTMLYFENKRCDRETGGPIGLRTIDEDLTDKQNEDFRYVLRSHAFSGRIRCAIWQGSLKCLWRIEGKLKYINDQ